MPEEIKQKMLAEVPIPKPLVPVKSPEVFERDALGRRTLIWATLHHKDITRNRRDFFEDYFSYNIAGEDGNSGKVRFVQQSVYRQLYHGKQCKLYGEAGHIVGRALGGSDLLNNLFIQNSEVRIFTSEKRFFFSDQFLHAKFRESSGKDFDQNPGK